MAILYEVEKIRQITGVPVSVRWDTGISCAPSFFWVKGNGKGVGLPQLAQYLPEHLPASLCFFDVNTGKRRQSSSHEYIKILHSYFASDGLWELSGVLVERGDAVWAKAVIASFFF